MADLQWQDALAAVHNQVFNVVERAQGWPAALALRQAANLQRPWVVADGDWNQRRRCDALFGALCSAYVAREIELIATSRQTGTPARIVRIPGRSMGGLQLAYTEKSVSRDVVEHRIAPGPFLAWLAAQGEEPSVHVRAWAKSQGASLRLVESPPTPLVDLRRAPEAGTAHSADAVSRWKRADGTWTDEAKAEMARLREAEKLTDQQIGKRFGVSRTNITRVIGSKLANKAKDSSSRKVSGQ